MLTHMGDGGIVVGGMVVEALGIGWSKLGAKEDGGHMMSNIVLRLNLLML